jgi:large subunit ribosomal protein L13
LAEEKIARRRTAKKAPAGPAYSVIDASGLVLGRASSLIAKRLLSGEHIVVVNAEKAVVVGSRPNVLGYYVAAKARGSVRKGPIYPRMPERIFRRTVRGMLPYKRSTGRDAFKRLMTYIGVPEEFKAKHMETLEKAKAIPSLREPMTLYDISKLLGASV